MPHHRQLAPIRLIEKTPLTLPHDPEPVFLVGVETVEKGGGGLTERARMTEHPAQILETLQIGFQDQLGMHAHRQLGGLGLDEGIAVAVAADPGTEADETRHPDAAAGAIVAPHRLLQEAIDPGHGLEQRLAEEMQPAPDLVGHLRLVDAHLVGLPQDLDLGQDLLELVLQLLLVELEPVQILSGEEDAPEGLGDGPAARLGRMGGEHRQIDQMLQQALEVLGTDAVLLELAHRVVERADPQPLAGGDHVHARQMRVQLLGDVHQPEIEREGADDLGERLGVEALDALHQLLAQLGIFLLAQLHETVAQTLHDHQHALATVLAQNLAQQGGIELDVALQRLGLRMFVHQESRFGGGRGAGNAVDTTASLSLSPKDCVRVRRSNVRRDTPPSAAQSAAPSRMRARCGSSRWGRSATSSSSASWGRLSASIDIDQSTALSRKSG